MIEAPVLIDRANDVDPRLFSPTNASLDDEVSKKIQGSLERKFKYGYNVLAEMDIFLQSLQSNGAISPEDQDYVWENNHTAMCEAVTSGGNLWSNHRQWDSERGVFLAFGTSFPAMLQAGIYDMRLKVSSTPEYGFELERREAELGFESFLGQERKQGLLKNRIFAVISPTPKEEPKDIASSLGYRDLDKLRFEVSTNNVRQTIELSVVARGSTRVYQRLVESLGGNTDNLTDSTSFLRSPIDLGDSANYMEVITDCTRRYDMLLEEEDPNGFLYFCGRKVETIQDKNYQELMEKQRQIRTKGKNLVDSLCNMDLELATSINSGTPTRKIMDSIQYWLHATDKEGARILGSDEWNTLYKVYDDKILSREAAFILKKNELVRAWTAAACVLNPQKAKEFFNPMQISFIRNIVEKETDWSTRSDFMHQLDEMIASAQVTFILCGGIIESSKRGRIFGLSVLLGLGFIQPSFSGVGLLDSEEAYYKPGTCGSCGQATEVGRCKICRGCARRMSTAVS